jgi:salicylate hydroxylase
MRFSRRSKRGSCRANNRLPWTKPRAAKRAQPIRGRSARGAVILEASQTHKRFHVGIVGGGIGGLALAQGLKKAGVSVALYERDATPIDRLQGYRVRHQPQGKRGAARLPARGLVRPFRGDLQRRSSALPLSHREDGGVAVAGVLRRAGHDRAESRREPPPRRHRSVRQGLHALRGDRRLHFADGRTATCDVLVGADGGNSRVRQQFLPQAQRIDTGVVGIAAKAMLTDDNRRRLPPRVLDGTGLVMAPGRREANVLSDNTTSYVFWAYGGLRTDLERDTPLEQLAPPDLQRLVLDRIRNWHPDYSVLVCASDPSTFYVGSIKTSVPVASWPTRRITLVGDAIHSMTPYRGIGANIALRDAALLRNKLAAAAGGEGSIEAAIHDYERQMRDYGFSAVRTSLQALEQAVGDKGLRFWFAPSSSSAPPMPHRRSSAWCSRISARIERGRGRRPVARSKGGYGRGRPDEREEVDCEDRGRSAIG